MHTVLGSAFLVVIVSVAAEEIAPKIPLRAGLTVVTAVSSPEGDYESIKRIDAVTPEAIRFTYSADAGTPGETPRRRDASAPGKPEPGRLVVHRTVRQEDWRSAHEYMGMFGKGQPDVFPNTTAITASTAVLTDLKTKGEASFAYRVPGVGSLVGGLLGSLMPGGQNAASKDLEQLTSIDKARGTLRRVEREAVPLSVLVNDERVMLPSIHAKGVFDDGEAEFYFLDDAANPLALKWKLGGVGTTLQVVKISFPPDVPSVRLEKALADRGRAEVYGIYFDFASATIRDESEPVLKEITEALARNPTWRLSVEGHTDNIGGSDINLELSKRRAAAVRQALIDRDHVDSRRLASSGFGASRPKESNDSIEGRARNRRVELVRP